MKSQCSIAGTATLAVVFAVSASAATRTWTQNAGGTYEWNAANFGGTIPASGDTASFTEPNANQTITGNGVAASVDVNNGKSAENGVYTRSRTFDGDIKTGNLVLRQGFLNVTGAFVLSNGSAGPNSRIGTASADNALCATLDILQGGSVVADGVHGIYVGQNNNSNMISSGRIRLRDGGVLRVNPSGTTASTAGLQLGRDLNFGNSTAKSYSSSFVQDGGHATLGRLIAGFEKNAAGSATVCGGVLDMPWISGDTRFRIGYKGYGIFQQLGGEIFCMTNRQIASPAPLSDAPHISALDVGSGQSGTDGLKGAYLFVGAGTFVCGDDICIQGPSYNGKTGVLPAHVTIGGTACVTSRTVRVGANSSDGRASLNLNGGTLAVQRLCRNTTRTGIGEINANGGTIVFPPNAQLEQFLYLDRINVFEGGLGIQCNANVYLGTAENTVPLRTPSGYGLSLSLSQETGNCFNPPWIEISGGSGSGAAAISLVDYDRNTMTNIVLACPGEGYAANDSVTASIVRLWGASATVSLAGRINVSLVKNNPGKLTKTGPQSLYLFSQPEFDGTYEFREGWSIQTTAAGGSPRVAAVVVGGTDGVDALGVPNPARFQCGSGNTTAVEKNWNPINPAATLTLGTAFGAGKLEIPAASVAAGETKPFEQTFAALTVNGTGNSVSWAGGNPDHSVGAKLSFGTISCAEGSQLTIPDPTSSFKVYCTGMPAGTSLKNIVFEGDSVHTAMVGDNGQLVPLPLAFLMVVR